MTTVRLPQVADEIESAARQIVDAAWPNLFVCPTKAAVKAHDADLDRVRAWLEGLRFYGAIARPELLTSARRLIEDCSEEMQGLGPFRVVVLINRRQWIGGRRAS